MPRRARRVCPNTQASRNSSIVSGSLTDFPIINDLQKPKKRTFPNPDPITPTSTTVHAATEPPLNKKARHAGPSYGRPMQLHSMNEGNHEIQEGELAATSISTKGKGKAKATFPHQRSTADFEKFSASVSLVDPTHATPTPARPAHPLPVREDFTDNADTDSESSDVETEKEWFDEAQPPELTQRLPSKVSEAMVIERPMWEDSSDMPPATQGSVVPYVGVGASSSWESSPSVSTAPLIIGTPGLYTSQGGSGGDAVDLSLNSNPPQATWPGYTDLVFNPGSRKVMLMLQHAPVRAVLHAAFENIRVYILFNNSFPDAATLPVALRGCLISAATESQDPQASDICERLNRDDAYIKKLSRLPRARISIYRADIKERCVALVQADFLGVNPPSTIAQSVSRQLSNYIYTFPMALNNNPIKALPMRTKPYRNPRIISVIRDLYFSGGIYSFAHQHRAHFPMSENEQGVMVHEVPAAMVALVGTALYAAIYEWRTGTQHTAKFSANAYLNVYNGHMQTLNYISEHGNLAFHRMMADIFMRVSQVEVPTTPGVPIAELNLEDLDN